MRNEAKGQTLQFAFREVPILLLTKVVAVEKANVCPRTRQVRA